MRFVYHDPYALRGALEDVVGQEPIGIRRERHLPIPVDVYQQGKEIAIEGALPGAQLKGYREVETRSNRRKGRSK